GFYPFREVAATLKDPAAEMYRQNVLVVGADFADGPGFIALTDTAPAVPLGYGSGEDLQDHDCKIAQ
ncbi:CDP-diacylglycerol diphosphatase, partial [Acinetobacter baumannii]